MNGINQFYDGALVSGHLLSENGSILHLDQMRQHDMEIRTWLRSKDHVVWIDLPRKDEWRSENVGSSRLNHREAETVARVVKDLRDSMFKTKRAWTVGVISMYSAQVRRIQRAVRETCGDEADPDGFQINTVDRFQGAERDIIILSLVLNGPRAQLSEFLKTHERVNVAMSRARRLLIVVGSKDAYTKHLGEQSPYGYFWEQARLNGSTVKAIDVLA